MICRTTRTASRNRCRWTAQVDSSTRCSCNELLAASDDGSVTIHDIGTRTRFGDPIRTGVFTGNGFVDLRSDGAKAALPGPDGIGPVLWDLHPDHWVTAACAIAGRNLTRDEWGTYIGNPAGTGLHVPSIH